MVRSRGNLDMYKANPQIAIDQQHNEVLSNIHLVFYELYFPAVSSYRVLIWLTTSYKTGPRTSPRTSPRTCSRTGPRNGPSSCRATSGTRSSPRSALITRTGKISRYSIPSLYAVRQWPTQFPTSI